MRAGPKRPKATESFNSFRSYMTEMTESPLGLGHSCMTLVHDSPMPNQSESKTDFTTTIEKHEMPNTTTLAELFDEVHEIEVLHEVLSSLIFEPFVDADALPEEFVTRFHVLCAIIGEKASHAASVACALAFPEPSRARREWGVESKTRTSLRCPCCRLISARVRTTGGVRCGERVPRNSTPPSKLTRGRHDDDDPSRPSVPLSWCLAMSSMPCRASAVACCGSNTARTAQAARSLACRRSTARCNRSCCPHRPCPRKPHARRGSPRAIRQPDSVGRRHAQLSVERNDRACCNRTAAPCSRCTGARARRTPINSRYGVGVPCLSLANLSR